MAPTKTPNSPRGTIIGSVQSGLVTFNIRAIPLPEEITSFLIVNEINLKKLHRDSRRTGGSKIDEDDEDLDGDIESIDGVAPVKLEELWSTLEEMLNAAGKEWIGVADQIWAFGPRRVGPNLLIDRTTGSLRS